MNYLNLNNRQKKLDNSSIDIEQDSDYEDDGQPVYMNFLEEIKGHLDGEISFETDIHDIYNPEFSETINHRIKQHQDTAFQRKQVIKKAKSTKSQFEINTICTLEEYHQTLEFQSCRSTQNEFEQKQQSTLAERIKLSKFKKVEQNKQN